MINPARILLIVLTFSWANHASSLTLQECFESAKKTNPRFEILGLDKKQEQIKKAIAVLDLLPKVELQRLIESRPNQERPNPPTHNAAQTSIDARLSQHGLLKEASKKGSILYAAGNLSLDQITHIASQAAISDANKYRSIEKEQQLITEGVAIYLQVCTSQQLLEVAQSLLEFTKNRVKLVSAKFSMGHATKTELLNAKAELVKAEWDTSERESKLNTYKKLFLQFFGIASSSDMEKPEDPKDLPESFEKFLELAFSNNPSLKSYRYAKKAKSAELADGIMKRIPHISYEMSKNISHPDQKLKSSISIIVPIIAKHGSVLDIPLRKHELRKSSIETMHAEEKLRIEVIDCWEDYDLKNAQIQMYKKFVEARSLALEGMTQEYMLGKGSLMEIYKAEQELKEVKKSQLEAESEFIKTKYKILSLCGNLSSYVNSFIQEKKPNSGTKKKKNIKKTNKTYQTVNLK
jgi:hypothetical protein